MTFYPPRLLKFQKSQKLSHKNAIKFEFYSYPGRLFDPRLLCFCRNTIGRTIIASSLFIRYIRVDKGNVNLQDCKSTSLSYISDRTLSSFETNSEPQTVRKVRGSVLDNKYY